jgi:hypothetical protein
MRLLSSSIASKFLRISTFNKYTYRQTVKKLVEIRNGRTQRSFSARAEKPLLRKHGSAFAIAMIFRKVSKGDDGGDGEQASCDPQSWLSFLHFCFDLP